MCARKVKKYSGEERETKLLARCMQLLGEGRGGSDLEDEARLFNRRHSNPLLSAKKVASIVESATATAEENREESESSSLFSQTRGASKRDNKESDRMASVLSDCAAVRMNNDEKTDSRLFRMCLDGSVMTTIEERGFRVWNGRIWELDSNEQIVKRRAKLFADALLKYATRLDGEERDITMMRARLYNQFRNRERLVKDTRSEWDAHVTDFDKEENLLNVRNGVIDLETRKFKPHDSNDMFTMCAAVNYDPDATCEEWESFLLDAMEGDASMVRFLQKVLSLGLTCDTTQQAMFVFRGKTNSGKSLTLNVVLEILGGVASEESYGIGSQPEILAQRDKMRSSSAPTPDLARLRGKRFVVVPEPSKQMLLNCALFKQLTGEDPITARFLNENNITFTPVYSLFMSANHLPMVNDMTVFDSDRLVVVPFDNHKTDEEQDKGLKARLLRQESRSGILNWLLDGLDAYRAEGLEKPTRVVRAISEYREDSDKLGLFIEEELVRDPECNMFGKDVHTLYQNWCVENGMMAEGKRVFFSMMRDRSLMGQGTVEGNTDRNAVLGYRLKRNDEKRIVLKPDKR